MPQPKYTKTGLAFGEKYPSTYRQIYDVANLYRDQDIEGLLQKDLLEKDLLDPKTYDMKSDDKFLKRLMFTMFGLRSTDPEYLYLKDVPWGKHGKKMLKEMEK